MAEKETVQIDYKQEVIYKNAELKVSNAKVGEYVSKLMDAETKNLLLLEENIKLKNKLEEFEMLKEDLDGKEILDIGTGSGCIAISLAKYLPNATVTALDISKHALNVAKENAKLNNVEVNFINADIFKYELDKKYDVIVSNPPYVLESEKTIMKKNVLNFEPKLALFVGDNKPLKYYLEIINFSKYGLKSKGMIFFEINKRFSSELKTELLNSKLNSSVKNDLAGFTRFIKAKY